MKVFVVWCYDDGIIDIFSNREAAEGLIKKNHDYNIYHEEDQIIIERELLDDVPNWQV